MANRKWKQAQPRGLAPDSPAQEGGPHPDFSPAFLFPSPGHGAARLLRDSPGGWLAAGRVPQPAGRRVTLASAVLRHDLSTFGPTTFGSMTFGSATFDPMAFGSEVSGAALPG